MECVVLCTGEFGVVYKAHYTEPEGDIGYKTSIVAVKTLKGMYVIILTVSSLLCSALLFSS